MSEEANDGIAIAWLGGNCPVQSEGTVDGKPYYFRARGMVWRLGIGGDPVSDPEWEYSEWYHGDDIFAAGWMEDQEAETFLRNAVALFRTGHPTVGRADAAEPGNLSMMLENLQRTP